LDLLRERRKANDLPQMIEEIDLDEDEGNESDASIEISSFPATTDEVI
jgi:hypothetical protein